MKTKNSANSVGSRQKKNEYKAFASKFPKNVKSFALSNSITSNLYQHVSIITCSSVDTPSSSERYTALKYLNVEAMKMYEK